MVNDWPAKRAVQPVPYFIRKILVSLNTAATAPAWHVAGNGQASAVKSDSEGDALHRG